MPGCSCDVYFLIEMQFSGFQSSGGLPFVAFCKSISLLNVFITFLRVLSHLGKLFEIFKNVMVILIMKCIADSKNMWRVSFGSSSFKSWKYVSLMGQCFSCLVRIYLVDVTFSVLLKLCYIKHRWFWHGPILDFYGATSWCTRSWV